MFEPWPECPVCHPKPPEHDHTRYGPAFYSYAAIALRESGADDQQTEVIMDALRATPR